MTATVALIILAIGIAIGYQLPTYVARWKAIYRRHTFKPVVVQRYNPGSAPAKPHRPAN